MSKPSKEASMLSIVTDMVSITNNVPENTDITFEEFVRYRIYSIMTADEVARRIRHILLANGAVESYPLAFGLILYGYRLLLQLGFSPYDAKIAILRFLNAVDRYYIMGMPSKTDIVEYVY